MSLRGAGAALALASMLALGSGCAAMRGQESVGAYVDDAAITTTVKARLVEDKTVDADAITVETANGNVVLSGVAKSSLEKSTAESIAMKVKGVKSVQNNVALRP
jgi:hyperosmotically inducible periplasmic protein